MDVTRSSAWATDQRREDKGTSIAEGMKDAPPQLDRKHAHAQGHTLKHPGGNDVQKGPSMITNLEVSLADMYTGRTVEVSLSSRS
jgi:DnaJ-class molecular chaperone